METFLRRISIRHRLIGGMLVVSVLILALGLWASVSYKRLQTQTDELLDAQASVSRDTSAMLAALERVQRHEQSVLLNSNNAVEAAEFRARWDKEVGATTAMLTAKTDDTERAALTVELQAMITDEVLWVPIVAPTNVLVLNKELTGAPSTFQYMFGPWAAYLGAP